MIKAKKNLVTKCPAGHTLVNIGVECKVCNPPIRWYIESAKLEQALLKEGVKVKAYSSQDGFHMEYGHAWLHITDFSVSGRKEGVGPVRVASENFVYTKDNPLPIIAKMAADILKTGRTCEVGQGVGVRSLSQQPHCSTVSIPWSYVVEMIDHGPDHARTMPPINMNPDYQRSHVWTEDQQRKFLGHLLEGGEQTSIFIQRFRDSKHVPPGVDYLNVPEEVVDGKQRLTAIYRFMKEEIGAELSNGEVIYYKDFDEVDRRGLDIKVSYIDLPRIERLRFYLKLNRGGTIHTESEISKVRDLLDIAYQQKLLENAMLGKS